MTTTILQIAVIVFAMLILVFLIWSGNKEYKKTGKVEWKSLMLEALLTIFAVFLVSIVIGNTK